MPKVMNSSSGTLETSDTLHNAKTVPLALVLSKLSKELLLVLGVSLQHSTILC